MSLPIPQLDDLDFEALIEQARSFIPQYAPNWTDHNIHDPGITLLELASWLVDQQIYRAGFVSDRHIRAFAALLGVRQQGAIAANGLIWPNIRPPEIDQTTSGSNVLAGARVTCVEQPEIVFAVAESVYISPARFAGSMEAVSISPRSVPKQNTIPVTDDDKQQLVAKRMAQDGSELFVVTSETSTRPVASSLKKSTSHSEDIELIFDRPLITEDVTGSYSPIAIGIELEDCNKQTTQLEQSPHGYLVADYRIEDKASVWRRAAIVNDTTAGLNQTGIVLITIPAIKKTAPGTSVFSRLRIRSKQRVNPLPPKIKRVELNVLPIVQTETIPQSIIGVSNGLPDQSFHINLEDLPQDQAETITLVIQLVEGERFMTWKRVGRLGSQNPDSRVYELCPESNEIRFGNGINGMIPPHNAQIRHLPYKLTQGLQGNLQSGLSWNVLGASIVAGQTSYGTNSAPMSGGEEAWDMEQLIAATRSQALLRTSLLSNAELENATKNLPAMGVERADVLVGFHPLQPGQFLKNTRSLVVIPERKNMGNINTGISQEYYQTIDQMLRSQRVMGERLSIIPARRVSIAIQADLLCEDGVDQAKVIHEAKQRLLARFSDIQISNDWNIDPWPLGRNIRCQEIKALLAAVTGVVAVTGCAYAKEDAAFQSEDIVLQRHEIAIVHEDDFSIMVNSIERERGVS